MAPQHRLYLRPEPQGQGSLQPTLRPETRRSSKSKGRSSKSLDLPPSIPRPLSPRDLVQTFRFRRQSRSKAGAIPHSSSMDSSFRSDRPSLHSFRVRSMVTDAAASSSSLSTISSQASARSRIPRSKPPTQSSHSTSSQWGSMSRRGT